MCHTAMTVQNDEAIININNTTSNRDRELIANLPHMLKYITVYNDKCLMI